MDANAPSIHPSSEQQSGVAFREWRKRKRDEVDEKGGAAECAPEAVATASQQQQQQPGVADPATGPTDGAADGMRQAMAINVFADLLQSKSVTQDVQQPRIDGQLGAPGIAVAAEPSQAGSSQTVVQIQCGVASGWAKMAPGWAPGSEIPSVAPSAAADAGSAQVSEAGTVVALPSLPASAAPAADGTLYQWHDVNAPLVPGGGTICTHDGKLTWNEFQQIHRGRQNSDSQE